MKNPLFFSCLIASHTYALYLAMVILLFFALTFFCALAAEGLPPILITENGPITGIMESSFNGREIYAYLGLPYAQPPVGSLRFEEPRRLTYKWEKPWRGEAYAPSCTAYDGLKYHENMHGQRWYNVSGSEDCLYLNVFTNEQNLREGSKDVIVFIHGGGFEFGSPRLFQGHAIMDRKNIVYVSIAYRLGVLGFLSTGDSVVPGNNGLKDQVAALEWVQRNIAGFGGDPSKVTISGMSAGGASVHFMFMSPLARGLFRRGYAYSGTALSPWAMWADIPEKTKKLAKIVGCPFSGSQKLVKCLKQKDGRDLIYATALFKVFLYNPFAVFGPVVEPFGERSFLSKHPLQYLKDGDFSDLPFITGVTAGEGYYSAAEYVAEPAMMDYLNSHWKAMAPFLLFFNDTVPSDYHSQVSRDVRKAFLGNSPLSTNARGFIRMLSDRNYVAPAVRSAIYMSYLNKSPVFLYHFRYRGSHTTSEHFTELAGNFDVGHADDNAYVFDSPGKPLNDTLQDRMMGDELVDLLASFAKKGYPPKKMRWTPFYMTNQQTYNYLEIDYPQKSHMLQDSNIGSLRQLDRIFGSVETFDGVPLAIVSWCVIVMILAAALLFSVWTAVQAKTPVLSTENGPVSGKIDTSINGQRFFSYLGLPFAKPPVGNLRFEEPQRFVEKWEKVRNATAFAPPCMCYSNGHYTEYANGSRTYPTLGSEDCLYLNVFTTANNLREGGKDVIVFIHGGGFQFGASQGYGAHIIMNYKDIVMSTITYRTGLLGFLSTGDEIVPGNNGLKDQIAALQWIQRNIANFGGDPKKVTIIGISAGGASVHLMYMTPLAKGLFRRGYAYSGTALNTWVMQADVARKTRKLAFWNGCPTSPSRKMVDCLKRVEGYHLVDCTKFFKVFLYNPFSIFGPVVEKDSKGAFISKHPIEYLKNGEFFDLPFITGVTPGEGYYSAAEYVGKPKLMTYLHKHWAEMSPYLMFFNQTVEPEMQGKVAKDVVAAFLSPKTITSKARHRYIQMLSDRNFIAPALRSVIHMTRKNKSPVYFYLFTYRGQKTMTALITKNYGRFGVGHADDAPYVFDDLLGIRNSTTHDRVISSELANIATQFVRTGKPPAYLNWEPFHYYQNGSFTYLEIKYPKPVMHIDSDIGSLSTLNEIFGPLEYFNGVPLT